MSEIKADNGQMAEALPPFSLDSVIRRIFELRGQRVMLDADLAVLYGVETKNLVKAIKRNLGRFPEDFMFQATREEWDDLRCQFGTSSSWGGRRYAPYVFTEHGALMLSSVLNSSRATEISLLVIRAFVWLRRTVPAHQELAAKVSELESAVGKHDKDIGIILEALRQLITPPDEPKRRIGF
jgi:hypothetical protein